MLIYNYFFPREYKTSPTSEMPRNGALRTLIAHTIRISVRHNAIVDIWFMRGCDELNSINASIGDGSFVEVVDISGLLFLDCF